MSLRIWLPLIKDLKNQGLDDITVTNNGATFNSAGKLGGCYSFGTGSSYIVIDSTPLKTFTEFSFACWVKIISWNTNYSTIFAAKNSTAISWNNLIFSLLRDSSSSALCFNISNGSNYTSNSCRTGALSLNTWYHITCIYKSGQIKLYQDGNVVSTYNTSVIPNFSSIVNLWIGKSNENSYQSNSLLNDVRIYDHALSPLEVKHIAQGLILHYPLNRGGLGPTNLLKNGFGELGIENWSYAGGMFSDVPENHPEIYHSYKNVESKEFIPIYRNHNYKFSTWIKTTASSGNSYPSICPYDADKLFIATNNCKEGFDLKTMTVLTRELKAGDTKIYVEDLSKWNANSGHYYDTVAIFGYKDGTGYIWPDGVYTRNCPAFSSGTKAKTNLDKTNNIITLLATYNGVTIPVGTKVCASAYGNTYFYPCGGIPYSIITNWTFKENTFSSEIPRLSAAKYIRVLAYSNCYQAGMTVTDLTVESFNNNIEYDCSGFCNNGEYYAYDANGSISYTSDTPKYNVSTHIASANPTQDAASGTRYLYGHCKLTNPAQMSVAFWLKPITGGYGSTTSNGQGYFCTTNYEYGNTSVGVDYQGSAMNHRDGTVDMNDSASTTQCRVTFYPTIGEWHHYVYTYDGQVGRGYKDGVQTATAQFSAAKTLDSFIGVVIGFSKAGGVWRRNDACYSDFRVYATALSADDVKSLYHNSAYIDNQGNIYGAIYEEV